MKKHRPSRGQPPKIGPITADELPSPSTTRWVARRKAQVVSAVRSGLLSIDEALKRYRLTTEEFVSWEKGDFWATKRSRSAPTVARA